MTIYGKVDLSILHEAILCYISENKAFSLRMREDNGIPYQIIVDDTDFSLERIDFTSFADPYDSFTKWRQIRFEQPFDIEGRLYDFVLYRLADNLYGYFVKVHHLISDGWSMQLLTSDIFKKYVELCEGKVARKEYPSYLELIDSEEQYLASERYVRDQQYWKKRLSNLSSPHILSQQFLKGKRETFFIDSDLSQRIKSYCKRNEVSCQAFFVASYLLFQYKMTGILNQTVGIPVLGRLGKRQRATFGMFVSAMPFRFEGDRKSVV